MKNKWEVILTGQLGGETHLSAILNHVENLENGLIKEPGCTQMPGCELSKTSPRRPRDVTKK